MIEAVIFDMDGLLVDSEPLWRQAEVEVFASVGVDLTPDDCRRTTGLRVDQVVEYWRARRPWDDEAHPREEIAGRIVDRVVELIGRRGELLPGAAGALDKVESEGRPLALASSSNRRIIDAVLARFRLADRFQAVHSGDDEPEAKPHPAIYLSTAGELGVRPSRCLAVEDSRPGLMAAKAAAMGCVLVPEDPARVPGGRRLADAVLDSLEEFDDDLWERLDRGR